MNIVKKLGGWMLPVLLLFGLMFPVHALAAVDPEKYQVTVDLPISVSTTGKSDTPATVKIAYKDGVQPAGTDTVLSDYTLNYTGDGTQTVRLHYTAPGDYVYTVTQTKGSAQYVTYDTTELTVTVRVTNSETEYGTLVAKVWCIRGTETEKQAEVKFTNTYSKPADPTPAPTAAPTATPKPASALPKTGDNFPLIALLVVAVLAAAGFGYTVYRKKKNGSK